MVQDIKIYFIYNFLIFLTDLCSQLLLPLIGCVGAGTGAVAQAQVGGGGRGLG